MMDLLGGWRGCLYVIVRVLSTRMASEPCHCFSFSLTLVETRRVFSSSRAKMQLARVCRILLRVSRAFVSIVHIERDARYLVIKGILLIVLFGSP